MEINYYKERKANMENELYHHGILGQKWGEQNGPPYPLSSSQKTVAEIRKAAGNAVNAIKNRRKEAQRNKNLKKARAARKKELERQEEIKKLTRSGSLKDILDNIGKLDPKDYKDVLDRMDFEQKLKTMSADRISKGAKATNELLTSLGKVGAAAVSLGTAYNTFASAYNSLSSEGAKRMKIIESPTLKSDNKDKN